MNMFLKDHFDLLKSVDGIKKDKDHLDEYNKLKEPGVLTQQWGELLAEKISDEAETSFRNRPTNQGNIFKSYTWIKIYPSYNAPKELAYTVGIDAIAGFVTKIDTINQDGTELRKKYEKIRGEFDGESPIISTLSIEEGIHKTVEELAEWSYQSIKNFKYTYDEVCQMLDLGDGTNSSSNISSQNIKLFQHPLNQILYGPAGTGKTYNTINYALSILDGRNINDPQTENDRKIFKKYMDEGRISFVTFHQSYGYEDFVEGIKVVSENNQLTYPIIPGIFKNICQLASANVKSNISEKFDLGNRAIWKMSLGRAGIEDDLYRSCLDNDVVLLGWGDDIDFTGCNELQTIKQKLTEFDYPINQLDTASSYVNTFKNKIKNGDLIVITDGNLKFRAIAEVIGAYEYDSEQEFSYHQVRKVKWLKSFLPSLKNEDYFKKIFSQSTVYNLENAVDKDKIQNLLTKGKNQKSNTDNKYVLIIDEINRGNISKIFGELITLIEESKRVGKAEALEIILPNSPNKKFGVPKNLYIIGTMNSSDRSLTSVDIALRRRFEFVEMMPKPDVLSGIDIEGVSVQYILETMNKRIKVLLDRDHCIGHAYFTPLIEEPSLELLMTIFEKRIIPLLQEYFFDDWTKINLVLGENGMVHTMNLDSTLFLSMNPSEIEHLKKRNWDVNNYLFQDAPLAIKVNALKQIISPKQDYKIPKPEITDEEAS